MTVSEVGSADTGMATVAGANAGWDTGVAEAEMAGVSTGEEARVAIAMGRSCDAARQPATNKRQAAAIQIMHRFVTLRLRSW